MANIVTTFNGFDNLDTSYIALTDIPNIITVEDSSGYFTGVYPTLKFRCNTSSLYGNPDGRFTISFFGETVTSVRYYENAVNKNFYISPNNYSTAASIARALRNCQSLASNFKIENNADYVVITGRKYFLVNFQDGFSITDTTGEYTQSQLWNNYFIFTSSDYDDGQNPSVLTNARVSVDIYSGETEDYVTTLEKVCPDYSVSFNVSPAITSIAEYGKAIKWSYRAAYTTIAGLYNQLTNPDDYTNYVSIGYMVNQGNGRGLHQIEADTAMVAQNVSRGDSNPSFTNHTLLYTYDSNIPLSFYRGNYSSGNINVTYRDSAYQTISSFTTTWTSQSANKLYEMNLNLVFDQDSQSWFNNAFYIDIDVAGQSLRYNVIKPLKSAEGYTRLYFRNSYGGTSFIDITGKRTETRDLTLKTYQKNIYDYQDIDAPNILDKIYDNQVKYTVTIKSHLFEGDGRWIYNDLLQSSKVWTYVNGEQYDIIIDSVNVNEQDNSNDIWEAEVKYSYSMHPSIL